jgi:hypothetical protein
MSALANYRIWNESDLLSLSTADIDSGRVGDWVAKIPAKYFIIVAECNRTSIEIVKADSASNSSWWATGQYWKLIAESDTTIFQRWAEKGYKKMTMYVESYTPVVAKKRRQQMREGMDHCIFKPIKDFYLTKLDQTKTNSMKKKIQTYINWCDKFAVKYDGGITVEELEAEALPKLNMTVNLHRIDQNKRAVQHLNGGVHGYTMNFINSRFNHAEIYDMVDENPEPINEMTMRQMVVDLSNNNIQYSYEGNNNMPNVLLTHNKKYRMRPNCSEVFDEFNKEIGREWFNVDLVKEPMLFTYIRASIKHNPHQQFQDMTGVEGLQEMDLTKAYTQFKQAPVYKGFLGSIWGAVSYHAKVSLQQVYKNIGIYTVYITKVNSKHVEAFGIKPRGKYVLTSPMIEYLTTTQVNGLPLVECKVKGGVYGSRFDMEFPEEFYEKYDTETGEYTDSGVPLYSIWTGMTASAKEVRTIKRKIDYRLAQDMRADGVALEWCYDEKYYDIVDGKRVLQEGVESLENPDGYVVQWLQKESSTNCPHVYSFIADYLRQNMIHEMLKIPLENIYALKVDSIVYTGDYENVGEGFRNKPVKVCDATGEVYKIFKPTTFVKMEAGDDYYIHECKEVEIYGTNTLYQGSGGSGKSHRASKLRSLIYSAPMWSMCVDFFKKYNIESISVAKLLGIDCQAFCEESHKYPANVFIDETTMGTEEWKEKALQLFKHSRVIFGGDFDDKGRPFQTTYGENLMLVSDMNTIQFPNDYRSTQGDPLIDVKKQIRNCMEENYGDYVKLSQLVKQVIPQRISTMELIDSYTVNDWVLCGTNENVAEWTALLQDKGDKFLCNKHTKNDVDKAFRGEDIALNGQIIYTDNNRCERRHGFTTHSAQGKTIENNIYIDMRSMGFDYCLLYTAISRAKRLSQIYLINE